MIQLSKVASEIKPSATLSLSAKAKDMAAQGKPVIVFSAGEPDFQTPEGARSAGKAAIDEGKTRYTATVGIIELRREIAAYYKRRFNLDYTPADIVVGNGAKPLIYEALMSVVNAGDGVVLFTPAWVSYEEQIRMTGGVPVLVDTLDTELVPTKDRLLGAITPATKGILINTPCNPTGAIYDEKTLRHIAEVAREHSLWIIYDEIYERLTYGGAKHLNILEVAPDLKEQTMIINGVSKSFAMTGWRIGYALGPSQWIKGVNLIQDHVSSNASSVAQWAALGAMSSCEGEAEKMRASFEERRNAMLDAVSKMPYVSCIEPKGAFYLFLDISKTPLPDDAEFSRRLLEEHFVAMVPGSAFFAPGYLRISYANSTEEIEEGMKRLNKFLNSL